LDQRQNNINGNWLYMWYGTIILEQFQVGAMLNLTHT